MNYKLSGMPQLRLFLFALSTLCCLSHFKGVSAQTLLPSIAEEGESYSSAPSQENLPETTIWSYDFSAGIPSTWGNSGFYDYAGSGTGTIWSAPFEYRGPTTSPSINGTVNKAYIFVEPNSKYSIIKTYLSSLPKYPDKGDHRKAKSNNCL